MSIVKLASFKWIWAWNRFGAKCFQRSQSAR